MLAIGGLGLLLFGFGVMFLYGLLEARDADILVFTLLGTAFTVVGGIFITMGIIVFRQYQKFNKTQPWCGISIVANTIEITRLGPFIGVYTKKYFLNGLITAKIQYSRGQTFVMVKTKSKTFFIPLNLIAQNEQELVLAEIMRRKVLVEA